MPDQPALHWIAVHVVHFFVEFLLAPHVKIVEASLPERGSLIRRFSESQYELLAGLLFFPAQSVRDFLFQHLQDPGGSSFGWLGDQQVDMLGHDHVPEELEPLPAAKLIENLHKAVASADGSQIRPSPIATESHKVQVAASVKSSQRVA
jgi:hypothetical protein